MIQTGKPAEVTLEEYPEISRTWIRRVTVELPPGFEAAEAGDGRKRIFRGPDCYELTANVDDVPCIIVHTQRGGPFIPLRVLSEGGTSRHTPPAPLWGGLFCPSAPPSMGGNYPTTSRRLCGLSRPAGDIFASNPGGKRNPKRGCSE